jgi:hypothetical protein
MNRQNELQRVNKEKGFVVAKGVWVLFATLLWVAKE